MNKTNDDCQCLQQLLAPSGYISSLVDALQMGSNQDYEYSEPMTKGGATGTYSWKSPFNGPCEYSIVTVGGRDTTNWVFSKNQSAVNADTTGSQVMDIEGYYIAQGPANSYPVLTPFLPFSGGTTTLYASLATSGGNASFATVVFRQKRVPRNG